MDSHSMTAHQQSLKDGICRVIHTRDKPMPIKVLGIIVALFSLGMLATSPVFGIVLALVAGGLLAYQSGIEVNFRQRSYRTITAFGPQAFGTWQPLPALTSVSVFRTQVVSRTYGRSNASFTSRDEVIQVNLTTERNERIRRLETEHMEEAFVFAKEVAQQLDLRLWDATSKEGQWVDLRLEGTPAA